MKDPNKKRPGGLFGLLNKCNLSNLLIDSKTVQLSSRISRSKSEVFSGQWCGKSVAVKKIKKSTFRVEELENIYELNKKKISKCISCRQAICENVIKLHGCYEENDFYCIVLERAEMSLKDLIEQNSDQLKSCSTSILYAIAKALHCTHLNNIVHLDVKPSNIVRVERDGKQIWCLADYGESIKNPKKFITSTNFMGSKNYVSPEFEFAARWKHENVKQSPRLDFFKCDVFSLGQVFHQFVHILLAKKFMESSIVFHLSKLACFMTDTDPVKRPDAEGVRKDPIFWSIGFKMKFLLKSDQFINRYETNPKIKQNVENLARNVLFGLTSFSQLGWINVFRKNEHLHAQLVKIYKNQNSSNDSRLKALQINFASVFDLLHIIVEVKKFETAEQLQGIKLVTKSSNLKEYLQIWLQNLDLIEFLYHSMHQQLKIYAPEFYSVYTIERIFQNSRAIVNDNEVPLKKRKMSH